MLAPLALTTLLVVAALQAAGVSLNLFHLISLILAAGLGLDYALFFEHAADDAAEQARTLHAVLACAAVDVVGVRAARDGGPAGAARDRRARRARRRRELRARAAADAPARPQPARDKLNAPKVISRIPP